MIGELVEPGFEWYPNPGELDSTVRREAHLWTFAGERAVTLHEYPTLDAALDAASGSARG